jgi:hypothetical protein
MRNPTQNAIEEEVNIPLESLLCSIRDSMQDDIEEVHIPFESLLISTRNPMQHAMEEVTHIPF